MKKNKLTVARRSIWFFLKIVAVSILVGALAICFVFTGMYVGNIYIVVTEGMALRAECILQDGSLNELSEYFTDEWLARDELLNSDRYADYTVTNYDHRLSIRGISALFGRREATMKVLERMASLSGKPNSDAVAGALPEWTDVLYEVTFTMDEESRWYISELKVIEENPPAEVKPTPDYSLLDTAEDDE